MEAKAPIHLSPIDYFSDTNVIARRQYEALRYYFVEKRPAVKVANRYNYTIHAFYSLIKEFKQKLAQDEEPFFKTIKRGRRQREDGDKLKTLIIILRKQYLSAADIKAILDTKNYNVSVRRITLFHAITYSIWCL